MGSPRHHANDKGKANKQKAKTEQIREWSAGIDEQLAKFDGTMEDLEHALMDINSRTSTEENKKKLEQKPHEEMKIEKMRLQLRMKERNNCREMLIGQTEQKQQLNV